MGQKQKAVQPPVQPSNPPRRHSAIVQVASGVHGETIGLEYHILLLSKGRTDEAVTQLREALRQDPAFADALKTLAAIEQAQKSK